MIGERSKAERRTEWAVALLIVLLIAVGLVGDRYTYTQAQKDRRELQEVLCAPWYEPETDSSSVPKACRDYVALLHEDTAHD
ncbi:MAG: hypothetical protein AAGH41_02855 [Pseudomonadota bacterium]